MLQYSDLDELFLMQPPLIDVRSPIEFAVGSLPGAVNLPLLTDEERDQIGKTYKQKGQEAAIALGETYLSGQAREARMQLWRAFCQSHPGTVVFCFRGGLRSSRVTQALLAEGVSVRQLSGGYKRARQFLMAKTEEVAAHAQFRVLGGLTGSGKTELLRRLKHVQVLDLEGLAKHRGSALGNLPSGQPSQVDFENQLAVALMRFDLTQPIWVEDEGRLIGKRALPECLYQKMLEAPVHVIQESFADRVKRLTQIYLEENYDLSPATTLDERSKVQFAGFEDSTLKALGAIQKRLGGIRYQAMRAAFLNALSLQRRTGLQESHYGWVSKILEWYYDPMYHYQLEKKSQRIVWRGPSPEFNPLS